MPLEFTLKFNPPREVFVVLLRESPPKGTWNLEMIEEIITSKDIKVRAATVRTASLRKVAKLTAELSVLSKSRK